ncbi:hypothetical protein Lesp02_83990 [Lentzea sp. NBRC 105346]|uniref:hypothetical protein n=1 Tax=Lentzea sp. NBRC 105346 TaxID=3032205 RepID=UPI0024A166E4|nr:hypothetical protein [Lentzea sp. NBRC 105346]GLZ36212.1 hypothetical protein Lesp02_83990 [Lentzea sp. NBRC 105346]
MPVDLSIDERRLRDLARAMRSEEDGKELRKDLTKTARNVLNPTRNAVRAAIKSMPSRGHAGPKLRSAIAGKVMVQIRQSGKYPGAVIRAKKTPNVRKFRNAPKRTNSRSGWFHPSIGNNAVRVHQRGKPGWFDDETKKDRRKYRREMRGVIQRAEARLRRKV